MARSKEVTFVALDVGPSMHDVLEDVGRALRGLAANKMLLKPSHELALILFGTTGTDNELNREMQEPGAPDQYTCISVAHNLYCPDVGLLSTLSALPRGRGHPDFVDVLTVALDLLTRTLVARPELEARRILKRVILISDFSTPVKEVDPDFIAAVVSQLQDRDALLEVIDIKYAGEKAKQSARNTNSAVLAEVLGQVRHQLNVMGEPSDVLGAFRARDVSASAWFTGNLHVHGDLDIAVKVTKKASKENLPTTGMYSDRSSAVDAAHAVARDVEVRSTEDPDRIVPPEERIRAYKYGRQFVPVDRDAEAVLSYAPDKTLEVLGIVERGDDLPRHIFLKEPWVCAPEKGNEKAVVALSAFARALARKNSAAILRWVARSIYAVQLMAATPLLGRLGQPDCLLLNHIPFQEDVRTAHFAGFEGREDLPTDEQVDMVGDLVAAFDLQNVGGRERLRCEGTANPTLHRMVDYFTTRALDPEAPVQPADEDPLVVGVLRPHPEMHATVPPLLKALPDVFPMKTPKAMETAPVVSDGPQPMDTGEEAVFEVGPAPATRVETVSTADPLGDFQVLLESAGAETAMSGLQAAIQRLVETSVGDRSYDKAVSCLAPLRSAAVTHGQAQGFNAFLRGLDSRFGARTPFAGFWERAVAAGSGSVSLISEGESTGGVSKAEADAWMREHVHRKPQVKREAVPALVNDEDELAGME